MDEHPTLDVVVAGVLAQLQRLHYSSTSQGQYRRFYKRLLIYARQQGIATFSEDLSQQFFEATFGIPLREIGHPVPQQIRAALRFLRCLSSYQRHGTLVRRHHPKPPYEPPDALGASWRAFAQECDRRGYSPRAARTRWARLATFVGYLTAHGVTPDTITAAHLSQYTASLIGYHPKTVATMLTTIRTSLGRLAEAMSNGPPPERPGPPKDF